MIVEGWIGPGRRHNRCTGPCQDSNDIAQKGVNPGPNQNLIGVDAMMIRQRRPQRPAERIPIPGAAGRFLNHCCDGLGGHAKSAFIRTNPGIKGLAPLALQRFRPDKGNCGGQAVDQGRERDRLLRHWIKVLMRCWIIRVLLSEMARFWKAVGFVMAFWRVELEPNPLYDDKCS